MLYVFDSLFIPLFIVNYITITFHIRIIQNCVDIKVGVSLQLILHHALKIFFKNVLFLLICVQAFSLR